MELRPSQRTTPLCWGCGWIFDGISPQRMSSEFTLKPSPGSFFTKYGLGCAGTHTTNNDGLRPWRMQPPSLVWRRQRHRSSLSETHGCINALLLAPSSSAVKAHHVSRLLFYAPDEDKKEEPLLFPYITGSSSMGLPMQCWSDDILFFSCVIPSTDRVFRSRSSSSLSLTMQSQSSRAETHPTSEQESCGPQDTISSSPLRWLLLTSQTVDRSLVAPGLFSPWRNT